MSADSKRGPGARAASTDAEQSYTFDDLCLALDWFSSGLCDCVAQARVLSDILRGAAFPFSPSSLFGRDGGPPGKPPHKRVGPEPPGGGPDYERGNGGAAHATPYGRDVPPGCAGGE